MGGVTATAAPALTARDPGRPADPADYQLSGATTAELLGF
jgi:hypothetical protein